MIAPEGYRIIAVVAGCGLALAVAAYLLGSPWDVVGYLLAFVLIVFTVYFFRDPVRSLPPDVDPSRLILAPADGKVVAVESLDDVEHINAGAYRVSIFLSIFDVHVNRVPANGTIASATYIPGEYMVAWHPKASKKNERAVFVLDHPSGTPIVFSQIAGLVARRIIFHLDQGDQVRAGERFGVIRFGSRMDVIVPRSVSIEVEEGDQVKAGLSVLGRIPSGEEHTQPAVRDSVEEGVMGE